MLSRNVILTIVQGADFDYIAPFIFSLKNSGYQGKLVVFACAMKGDAILQMEKQGVIVVPYAYRSKYLRELFFWPVWPIWRFFFASKISRSLGESLAHIALPLFYRRHLIYLQFLRAHRHEFDRVFLTDARDVLFQSDPFGWNPGTGLHFFLLNDDYTVSSSQLYLNWTERQFPRTDYSKHRDKTVSCAGTTFGDTDAIITYLAQMVSTSLRARKLRKIKGGDDQGVHNYLIYEQLLAAPTLHPNYHGPVQTMGTPKSPRWRVDTSGRVLNLNGEVVPIVHQYDRIPELKEILLSKVKHSADPHHAAS